MREQLPHILFRSLHLLRSSSYTPRTSLVCVAPYTPHTSLVCAAPYTPHTSFTVLGDLAQSVNGASMGAIT
jgi:hypothetical protein